MSTTAAQNSSGPTGRGLMGLFTDHVTKLTRANDVDIDAEAFPPGSPNNANNLQLALVSEVIVPENPQDLVAEFTDIKYFYDGKLGMGFAFKETRITRIDPGKWADSVGLRVGDEILCIQTDWEQDLIVEEYERKLPVSGKVEKVRFTPFSALQQKEKIIRLKRKGGVGMVIARKVALHDAIRAAKNMQAAFRARRDRREAHKKQATKRFFGFLGSCMEACGGNEDSRIPSLDCGSLEGGHHYEAIEDGTVLYPMLEQRESRAFVHVGGQQVRAGEPVFGRANPVFGRLAQSTADEYVVPMSEIEAMHASRQATYRERDARDRDGSYDTRDHKFNEEFDQMLESPRMSASLKVAVSPQSRGAEPVVEILSPRSNRSHHLVPGGGGSGINIAPGGASNDSLYTSIFPQKCIETLAAASEVMFTQSDGCATTTTGATETNDQDMLILVSEPSNTREPLYIQQQAMEQIQRKNEEEEKRRLDEEERQRKKAAMRAQITTRREEGQGPTGTSFVAEHDEKHAW
ncbi:unnamed protein product [Amoebophrya sp. A25]|nr:unnamed protein product [Amoebophrya sp. A25]|eukprot:GSA25T00003693001.1